MRRRVRLTLRALLVVIAAVAVGLYLDRERREALRPRLAAPVEAAATAGSGAFDVIALDAKGQVIVSGGVTRVERVERPWVVVVAAIDHEANLTSFAHAAESAGLPSNGLPDYRGVELARQ